MDGRVCVGVRVQSRIEDADTLKGDDRHLEVGGSRYKFDCVLWGVGQRRVFTELGLSAVSRASEGYHAAVFGYGPTGSGKTHSLWGSETQPGLLPRACRQLLKNEHLRLKVACYEVYNERIRDLLAREGGDKSLRVREHPVTGPYVEELTSHPLTCLREAQELLKRATQRRVSAATQHNEHSSRSHAVFQISVASTQNGTVCNSRLSFVDLAGSERLDQDRISGDRYREGLSINKSLLTLGKVINALADSKKANFIPYRDSVLTWLLKENLGQNSYTTILATVNPARESTDETLATLRYACRARKIVSKVTINEEPHHKLIRELRTEIDRLKSAQDLIASDRADPDFNKKCDEIERLFPQLRRDESMTLQLQAEIKRLSDNLDSAERRRDELECHNNKFIENIKSGNVSCYESDFYNEIQSILNESNEEDSARYAISNIEKSLETLRTVCRSRVESNVYSERIAPILNSIRADTRELNSILNSYK